MDLYKELSVTPYIIFPVTTLVAMGTDRLMDEHEMLEISGVGQSMFERTHSR